MIWDASCGISGGKGNHGHVSCATTSSTILPKYISKQNQILKAQSLTFFPLWKNAAPRMCSPGKEAVPRQSQSLRMWSLKVHNCTFPAVSATSSLSPGKSHSSAVTPTLLETTLKRAVIITIICCVSAWQSTHYSQKMVKYFIHKKRDQLYRIRSPQPFACTLMPVVQSH